VRKKTGRVLHAPDRAIWNIIAHRILGGLHHRYARDLVFGSDSYFAMFWMAWRFAVRVTEPRSRARDRGEPSAVLIGYAATDDLWSQSALLL
jgi:hypothetical protein